MGGGLLKGLFGTEQEKVTRIILANTLDISLDKVTEEMLYSIEDKPKGYVEGQSWDKYYYNSALTVASNSKCLSRHIGGVLVRDKTIIGSGYNGPPRGIPHCNIRHQKDTNLYGKYKKMDAYFDKGVEVEKCPRQILGYKSGEGLDLCVAGHCERNMLINSAREGISTKGAIMYLTCGVPCTPCMVEIINAGISEVVLTDPYLYDASAGYLLAETNVNFRLYDFLVERG